MYYCTIFPILLSLLFNLNLRFVRLGILSFELTLVTTTKCSIGVHVVLEYLLFLNTKCVLRLHCGSNCCRHKGRFIYVWGYTNVANVGPQKWVDHDYISNTVDRTAVFRVVGGATSGVPTCSGNLSLVREKVTEKIGYKIFELSVFMFCVCLNVCLSLQIKRTVFSYMRDKCVFSVVQITVPVF
jgi:hypothetical protein